MVEFWQVIKDAGPLALAAAFFLVWYLERDRANMERKINLESAERSIKAITDTATAVGTIQSTLTTITAAIQALIK